MRHIALPLGLSAFSLSGSPVKASTLTVHVGPPSIGSGGSNPLSLPPLSPLEWEVTYVNSNNFESNIALTPGLLFGYRADTGMNSYVGMGGGWVISGNGTGPGIYSSLGLNLGQVYKFNIEVKQALGYALGAATLISPYAIRAGMTFDF